MAARSWPPRMGVRRWSAQTSGTTSDLVGVSFVDQSHGWAVGHGGTILATTDGGATWSAQTSGTTQLLWGVSFVDQSHGWAVGLGDTILATTDGGATWSAQSSPIPLGEALSAGCGSWIRATAGRSAWSARSWPPPTAGRRGAPRPRGTQLLEGGVVRRSERRLGGRRGRRDRGHHERGCDVERPDLRHHQQPERGVVHRSEPRLGGRR